MIHPNHYEKGHADVEFVFQADLITTRCIGQNNLPNSQYYSIKSVPNKSIQNYVKLFTKKPYKYVIHSITNALFSVNEKILLTWFKIYLIYCRKKNILGIWVSTTAAHFHGLL